VTGRVARIALVVLVVGLAVHNLAMALLWQAGLRGGALDVAAAWKEAVLVVAFVAAVAAVGAMPRLLWADRLALAYGALVVLYWVVPQSWLDGGATPKGELYALRHHLLPLGAYALGRLVTLDRMWWRRVGLTYRCLSYLPENWILNTDEESPVRRLVSTFLSPLATAYTLVVTCLLLAAVRPRRWTLAAGTLAYAGLLWTHTRAAFIALPAGLLVLAALRRSPLLAGLAAGSVVASLVFVALFPTIGPQTSYTPSELLCLRENAAVEGEASDDPFSAGESSTSSHLTALRDGIRTVARHPWGYGLGNSGVSASRTGVEVKAGESSYTELGVDAGVLGLAALVGWLVALAVALRSRSAWLTACVAAVAVLGLQTDVIGIHWLSVVVFALAGSALRTSPDDDPPEAAL
jgi:hypothetical protein